LHDVWPSPVLVYCIYIFGSSWPLTEFCHLQNSLCVQVLRFPILSALLHVTRAVGISQSLRHGTGNGITELSQGRHLYSAWQPSHWSSAHILGMCAIKNWTTIIYRDTGLPQYFMMSSIVDNFCKNPRVQIICSALTNSLCHMLMILCVNFLPLDVVGMLLAFMLEF